VTCIAVQPHSCWCIVVSHADRSGLLGAYGPYQGKDAAERAAELLRHAGVHQYGLWECVALHAVDARPVPGDPADRVAALEAIFNRLLHTLLIKGDISVNDSRMILGLASLDASGG
jgi:hypothetical protein